MNQLGHLLEERYQGSSNFRLLRNFTFCSRSSTDVFQYVITDCDNKCIYLVADTVSDDTGVLDLVERARAIPAAYGYVFYRLGKEGEEAYVIFDSEYKQQNCAFTKVQEFLDKISPIDFKCNIKQIANKSESERKNIVKRLKDELARIYGINAKVADILLGSVKRRNPLTIPDAVKFFPPKPAKGTVIYRYLSDASFNRIINGNRDRLNFTLSSICSMNDKWEYAFGGNSDGKKIYFRDENTPNTFLMSLSSVSPVKFMDMWRLYGGDACGVCLEFEVVDAKSLYSVAYVKNYEGVSFYPFYVKDDHGVCYALPYDNPKPEKLYTVKNDKYKIEKEVRMIAHPKRELSSLWNLRQCNKDEDGIHFDLQWFSSSGIPFPSLSIKPGPDENDAAYIPPLKLKRIFIGPNAHDAALKKAMILRRLQECGSDVSVEIIKDFGYKPSK